MSALPAFIHHLVYSLFVQMLNRFSYFPVLEAPAWLRALAGCASGVASASGPEVSLPARGGRFDGRAGKRAAGVAAGLARGAGVTSADRAPKPSADPGSSASFPMKGMAVEGKHLASQ